MKLVVQVKLLPTSEQAEALEATLHQLNQAATQVSRLAFETKTFGVYALRRSVYGELKAAGLGAQQAQHVIKKVADAYTSLRGLIRNGRLTGRRRRKAESKPITFRPEAAHPFDDRCLSWLHDARTVSIWTVHGRVKNIAFTGSADQLKRWPPIGGASRICCCAMECGIWSPPARSPRRRCRLTRTAGSAWTGGSSTWPPPQMGSTTAGRN